MATYDEMYLGDEEAEEHINTFYPSNHNTSPITLYPQQHMANYFSTGDEFLLKAKPVKSGIELIIELIRLRNISIEHTVSTNSAPIYHYLFSESSSRVSQSLGYGSELVDIGMCIRAGLKCMEVELRGLVTHHPAVDKKILTHISTFANNGGLFYPILNSYTIRDRLETFKQQLQLLMVMQEDHITECNIGLLNLYANRSVIIGWFTHSEHQLMLLNYDQFIMLLDTIISRSCALTACLINDQTGQHLLPSLAELTTIYSWGDKLILENGFSAYAAIGEFESLLTCKMIGFANSDPLNLSADYNQSIYDNAKDIHTEYGINPDWVDKLFIMLDEIKTINKLSEIFGIRKHWGNPILDAKASGQAVQDKAKEYYPIDEETMVLLLASFQRMMTLEFIRKEGKWPECIILDGYKHTPLAIAHSKKSLRINELHKDHKFQDWAGVKFLKNVSIDKCLNPLELLSDKSCSLYQQHLDSIYVYGYRNDEDKYQKDRPAESRRLLLEYMRRDHLSIEEIFKVVQTESIPDEWLVNLCALKGTEMKHHKGRIFAVLPYELRQYFSGTEDLIKRYIFPYNPHQTMTMKEDQLIKLLADITGQLNPDSTSRDLHVIHIVDFSKWNLRMSEENTSMIFNSIDNFLGTPNLIEATHYIFDKMINVVQDAFNPPANGVLLAESSTTWSMHNRGWEGQRQRGWTGLTSALLAFLEYLTGVNSKILGQGDNQILVSKFRIPDEYKNAADWIARDRDGVRKRLDDFYSVLVEQCLKIGLPVKKSETCRSLVFCNYGKRLYQYGVELSMELKRTSRIATESNDTFPTTDSLLKTMTSSAAASPIFGPPSITSLMVSHINVAITLHRAIAHNPLLGAEMMRRFTLMECRMSSDLLAKMMWLPACLGGPHRTTLVNSLYRGHPDPIAGDFATVTLAARAGSSFHKKLLIHIIGLKVPARGVDIGGLISSPFSLNVEVPVDPLRPLLKAISVKLASYCKNSDVKPLFSILCDAQKSIIVESLDKLEPFHPIIANEIFSRSLPGRKESFLAGFKNTTSFAQLLRKSGESMRLSVGALEMQQVIWWVQAALSINSTNYSSVDVSIPHHILLQKAREATWNRNIEGVTVPHPVEAITLTLSENGVCSSTCIGLSPDRIDLVLLDDLRVSIDSEGSRTRLIERVPNRMGYLGNMVSEGMICKTLRTINHSSALEDAMRLNVIRRWVTEADSELDSFLKDLIAQRTDLTLEELNELTGIPVRLSYTHRAASIATKKKCSVACNTNIHSQIYISSNSMGELNRTDDNFSFVFGQSFLMCQHLIGYNEFYNPLKNYSNRVCYHGHVTDTNSIPSVYDGSITIRVRPKNTAIFQRPACLLLYIERKYLELEVRGNRISPDWWQRPENTTTNFARLAYGVQMVGDTFIKADRIKSLLNIQGSTLSNRRDAPITAGDISGIGIVNYIKAISQSLLLHIPFDVIYSQVKNLHSTCCLSLFIDKVGLETWDQLFSPLLVPKVLKLLIPHLPKVRNAKFGVNLDSIKLPVQTMVVLRVGKMIQDQQQLLFSVQDDGNRRLSEVSIFSDGPNSTTFLMSRYLEFNVALVAGSIGTSTQLAGVLAARQGVREIHNSHIDDYDDLLRVSRAAFMHCVRTLFGEARSTKQLLLPTPRFADLNACWGAVVQKSRRVLPELLPSKPQSTIGVHIRMLKPNTCYDFISPDRPVNRIDTECSCFNFLPHIALPAERFYMPRGVSSKDHYTVLEAINSLDLSVIGVASLGYPAASELRVIAKLPENERVYSNPLLPLTEFAEHTAGSYIPGEFYDCAEVSKLVFSSEAVLSHSSLAELPRMDFSSLLTHLSGSVWTAE